MLFPLGKLLLEVEPAAVAPNTCGEPEVELLPVAVPGSLIIFSALGDGVEVQYHLPSASAQAKPSLAVE